MWKEIKNIITKHNKIILVPHIDVDLDAFGACLGLYQIIDNLNKKVFIDVEEKSYELGVKRAIESIKNININIEKIKNIDITEDDLIILLDHHKKEMMQNKDILQKCKNIIVIDHHIEGKDTINNLIYKYINPNISSASEIITNIIYEEKVKLNKKIANILLAGITIDTNNFTIKTSADTHKSAAILNDFGADSKDVQYLLKEDLKEYINIQKIIFKTEILDSKYAIACGSKFEIYEREQLSKIADSLLSFDKIEASFAIGKINSNIISISARSLGNVNVQKIMEKLSGGGNKQYAACMMYNTTIDQSKEKLIDVIRR